MISLGFDIEIVLNTFVINLWKPDNPVKKVSVLKKPPRLFVNTKSIQFGLWALFKQVGSFSYFLVQTEIRSCQDAFLLL